MKARLRTLYVNTYCFIYLLLMVSMLAGNPMILVVLLMDCIVWLITGRSYSGRILIEAGGKV